MAGLRGNQAWLMVQKQAAKGTLATPALPGPAVPGAYKVPFSGGSIGPVRETDNLTETDAKRDRGDSFATSGGVEGSPEFYVRDGSIGFFLHAALGTDAVAGTSPNFTHTISTAETLPYVSAWRMLGGVLWESFRDCKVGSLTISGDAGGRLTATAGIQGLVPARLTADPSVTPAIPLESSTVYSFNDAAISLNGGATSLISSFELSIENNLSRQQTDDFNPYDVVEGTREVSLGFDMIFETLDEYNKFHYGGAAGTAISNTIYSTTATTTFTFTAGANNEIAFSFPKLAYEEFPLEPDAAGDPITVSVRAVAQRHASGPVTATVKNQAAVY